VTGWQDQDRLRYDL